MLWIHTYLPPPLFPIPDFFFFSPGDIIGASSLEESTNAHDLQVINKLVCVAFKADLTDEELQDREKEEVLTDDLFVDAAYDDDSKTAVKDIIEEPLPTCHLHPSNLSFDAVTTKSARITAMGGEQEGVEEEDIEEEETDSGLSSVNFSFEETKSANDDEQDDDDGEDEVVKDITEETNKSPPSLPTNLFSIEKATTNSADSTALGNEQICAGLEYLWDQATAGGSTSKNEEEQTENMKEEHKTTNVSFEQVNRSMNVEDEEPLLMMDEEKDGAGGDNTISQSNETVEELMSEQSSCHSDSELSESSRMLLHDEKVLCGMHRHMTTNLFS